VHSVSLRPDGSASDAKRLQPAGVGAEKLIGPCEQDERIEAMECVNSILAMSGDVKRRRRTIPLLVVPDEQPSYGGGNRSV